MDLVIRPGAHAPSGVLEPPPDKSISHRALLGALLARGTTIVEGLSRALDVTATLEAIRAFGAVVSERANGTLEIDGPGIEGLVEPEGVIDVGNSGTLARLGLGVATLVPGLVVIDGDASVRRRPMARVIEPLRSLGAVIDARGARWLPAAVRGARLAGGTIELRVASAQVKSALLLAGLGAASAVSVVEPVATRPHTEELLGLLGLEVDEEELADGRHRVSVVPGTPRPVERIVVARDPSAAAFFVVAAAATPGARLEVRGAYLGPTRTGYLDVLRRMGAEIEVLGRDTVIVRGAALGATTIVADEVPSLIDEVPVLAVAFAAARGTSRIEGAAELRVKESDRIETTARMLEAFGATVETSHDGFVVEGPTSPSGPVLVDSVRDHRIAMSAAVWAATQGIGARIRDAEWVATSYPGFVDDFVRLCEAVVRTED